MKLKTKAWPDGRDWPDELTLDVGSNMPHDVYGIRDNHFGVLYVRHDVATKRYDEQRTRAERAEKHIATIHDIAGYHRGRSDVKSLEDLIKFIIEERDTLRKQLEEANSKIQEMLNWNQ